MSRTADTLSAPIATPDVALVAHGLLGCAEADFARFARAFRSELAPRDLCEGLQVDLAIMALMLLRKALAALMAAPADPKRLRAHASAHKMLTQALREFARLRKAKTAIPAAPKAVAVAPPPKPAAIAPPDRVEIAPADNPQPVAIRRREEFSPTIAAPLRESLIGLANEMRRANPVALAPCG